MWWFCTSKLPTKVPIHLNFMPSWWHHEYGICFGEQLFKDPEYRAATSREMNRLAHERFKHLKVGESNPPLIYISDDLGNATFPAALGCEVLFYDDNYPAAKQLSKSDIEKIELPKDISKIYPFCEIIRQSEYVKEKHNVDMQPFWPLMGVQNIAVILAGAEFLVTYYSRPKLAKFLLDCSVKLMLDSIDYFLSNNIKFEQLSNQNCTVPLAGPKIYKDFLFQYEKILWDKAQDAKVRYCIHHCGHLDDYIPLYRQLDKVDSIEVGWGSDLKLVLDSFPEAEINYIISSQFVKDSPLGEIKDKIASLLEAAHAETARLVFSLCDIESNTPDENINTVIEALL